MVNRSKNVSDLVSKKTEFGQVSPHNFRLKPIARVLGICALGLGFGLAHSVTQAATIAVDTNSDTSSASTCTLRDAIVSLNTASLQGGCVISTGAYGTDDTVTFSGIMAAGGSIQLTGVQLSVGADQYSDVTIDASSTSGVIVDANNLSSVIAVVNSATLTIDNLTITGGSAGAATFYTGGGIYVGANSKLTAIGSTISSNTASNLGGGVVGKQYSELRFESSTITGNSSGGSGGGVHAKKYSELALETSTVSSNTANDSGGGIYSRGVTYIDSSEITNNVATENHGGGIATIASLNKYSGIYLVESTVSNNTAGEYGGGIRLAGVVTGGESASVQQSTLFMFGSTISSNSASSGGGMSVYDSIAYVKYNSNYGGTSTISNNTATDNGGGVSVSSSGVQGSFFVPSAYFGSGSPTNSSIQRTVTVSNNNAGQNGGGIYVGSESSIVTFGASSTISSNSAGLNGGGLHFAKYSGGEIPNSVKYSTIDSNKSGLSGGGFHQKKYSEVTFLNSTISNNTAGLSGYGGPSSTGGGGSVMWTNAQTTLVNSTVSGNFTDGDGGAGLQASYGASITLYNSTVSNNKLNGGEGAVRSTSANVEVINSIIANSSGGVDCFSSGGSFIVDAYSIIENSITCSSTRTGDPGLEGLADNGGPTKTHLPRQSSKAINTGDNLSCNDFDQRFESRLLSVADACDVGAVEFKTTDIKGGFYVIPLQNGKVVVIPE